MDLSSCTSFLKDSLFNHLVVSAGSLDLEEKKKLVLSLLSDLDKTSVIEIIDTKCEKLSLLQCIFGCEKIKPKEDFSHAVVQIESEIQSGQKIYKEFQCEICRDCVVVCDICREPCLKTLITEHKRLIHQ